MTSLADTPTDPMTSEPGPLQARSLRTRTILSFGLAIAVLVFFGSRLEIDLARTWTTIQEADFRLFALAFGVYYFTFPLRGFRWQALLRSSHNTGTGEGRIPSVFALSEIIFLGWFANCVIPAKLGDAYRGYQLKRVAGLSFAHSLGTIVAERVIDLVVLVTLLVVSLGALSRSEQHGELTGNIFRGGLALLAVGAASLGGMWLLRNHLHTRLPEGIQAQYLRFQHGTLGSFRSLPTVTGITVFVWLCEASRLFLVLTALNLPISFPYALFVSLANSLLTVVPFTPGGLGLVEAGVVGLLLLGGADKEAAVAAALLDRTITYWSLVGLGFPLFLYRRRV